LVVEESTTFNDYQISLLNSNQTIFSIPTNLQATFGNSLNPNMVVNLYLTISTNEEYLSDLLIKNVRIISLKDSDGKEINSQDSEQIPYIINFAVDKSLIPLLNIALRIGEINYYVAENTYDLDKESELNNSSIVLKYLQ